MYFEPRAWATGQRGFYFTPQWFPSGLLVHTAIA
jgi:hypothetical protein